MYQVVINFEEEEDARNFVSWMNNQGEQAYWEAIEDQYLKILIVRLV
jgi:hypothetical protein